MPFSSRKRRKSSESSVPDSSAWIFSSKSFNSASWTGVSACLGARVTFLVTDIDLHYTLCEGGRTMRAKADSVLKSSRFLARPYDFAGEFQGGFARRDDMQTHGRSGF